MNKHGGRRKGAGRKKGIGITYEIQKHCERFIEELLRNEAIRLRATKQLSLCLEDNAEHCCYVIQGSERDNTYKIGYTSNWDSRKRQYVTHLPSHRVLFLYKGSDAFEVEGDLHAMFSNFNTSGEWFELPPERVVDLCVELTTRQYGRT